MGRLNVKPKGDRDMTTKGVRYMKTVAEKVEYLKVFSESAGFGETSYWLGAAEVATIESELTGGNNRGAIIIHAATLLVQTKVRLYLLQAICH